MSTSSTSSMFSSTISRIDERQWVIQIRKTLDEELDEEDFKIPVTIFGVPKTLLAYDPDSYIPHLVPIGPYHSWREEMYEMERYKLAAAKRLQQNLENLKFEDVVEQLTRHEPQIRACYHKCLTCNGETLAWLMAVDACFLLEFLQIYALEDGKLLHRKSLRMSYLVDITGRKSAHNAILRDMVMLENQIPLFVLRKVAEIKFSSLEMADELLFQMLMGFSQVLSPFETMKELPQVQAMECAHVLDFLYHFIVPKLEQRPMTHLLTESGDRVPGGKGTTLRSPSHIRKLVDEVWKILSKLNKGPIRILKKIVSSKIVVFITKLPWTIISNIPGIKLLKGPIEALLCSSSSQDKEKDKTDSEDSRSASDDKPPLVEEIAIPSVTDLSKASVNFLPSDGGILSIKFDIATCTFHLPLISLDEKTEVLLKNLVAYEACNASGPVIFTRYTELMNGIIDTEEDVRILREKCIIENRLKSDAEAAKLWNGMNRSVRLTKVPHLDKVIGDVNKFYNGRWNIKVRKLLKAYVYGSWQFLTLLACIMLLLLMTLQAFCTVYSCERIFHIQVQES